MFDKIFKRNSLSNCSNSNTQEEFNSEYRSALDHNDEESVPIGQNSSLSHFISGSNRLDDDEEDEPLLLRQRNSLKQATVNKNPNESNSSEESEVHQERLSDSDDEQEEEEATEEDEDDEEEDDDDDLPIFRSDQPVLSPVPLKNLLQLKNENRQREIVHEIINMRHILNEHENDDEFLAIMHNPTVFEDVLYVDDDQQQVNFLLNYLSEISPSMKSQG